MRRSFGPKRFSLFLVALGITLVLGTRSLSPMPVVAQMASDRAAEADRWQQSCQTDSDRQQYLAAIPACKQSVDAFRALGDRLGEADALYQLGIVFDAVSRSWEAIEAYRQAVDLYQAAGNQQGQANALHNLGDTYRARSQYEWAIDYYQQALSLYRTTRNLPGEAKALMNLGVVYQAQANYQLAINFYEDALPRFLAANDRQGQAQVMLNLGDLYRLLSQDQRAIAYYQEALPLFRQGNDRQGEATGLISLGNAYAALEQTDRAIEHYTEALPIFLAVNDRQGEANALLRLGDADLARSQYSSALDYHTKALRLFRAIENRHGEAHTLNSLGLTYHHLTQYQTAIDAFESAIAIYDDIGDRNGQAVALGNLGQTLFTLGDQVGAEETLQRSLQLLESIRSNLKTDRDRVSLFDIQRNPYVSLQQVMIAQGKPIPALAVAERGRARAFVELLAKTLPAPQGGEANPSGNPNLANATQPLTIAEIKRVAQAQKATLVEYSIIDEETLYSWVVKPTGEITFARHDLTSLPTAASRSGLQTLIDQMRVEDLGTRGRGISFVEDATVVSQAIAQIQSRAHTFAHLQALHRLLIAPIAAQLPPDPNDRVVFLPQGPLFFVPFPALQAADQTFLIEQHTITTAPAIQVLDFTQQQRLRLERSPKPTRSALVVGNPTMPQIGTPPQQLASLPGAEAEAKAIATLLNTQALIGNQAKKSTILQQMPSAHIIHLATHGLLDDYQGLGIPGAIALAPDQILPAQGGFRTIDGLLTASEILGLRLQAEMVVLSACDTGRGTVTGDGVIGLSRSLITAGAPTVLVSLWKVPDDATSTLMQQFYQTLQTPSTTKAQALRQAMLTAKAQFADPKDWAAFTLIGEAD